MLYNKLLVMPPTITVFGSICLDLALKVPHLPSKGETVLGTELAMPPGGKGFNQALQAHRLGSKVYFFGRLGDDAIGNIVLTELEKENFPVRGLRILKNENTALGLILIAPDGTNLIGGFSGANMNFSHDDIDQNVYDALLLSSHLILQLEIPDSINLAVLRLAKEQGVRTIMNYAPYRKVPDEVIKLVDVFIFNELEASGFFNRTIETPDDLFEVKKSPLYDYRKLYIVTLGANGAAMIGPEGECYVDGQKVDSVDSTGAGDSFVGSYVHFVASGEGYYQSLELANIVAAESTTVIGAMPSLPDIKRVKKIMVKKGIELKKGREP